MDRRKKALILAALAATLQLSGCSKNNNNEKENKASIIQEYNSTVEKEFEIGEHFVTEVYDSDSMLKSKNYEYVLDAFDNLYIPEGYSVYDCEFPYDHVLTVVFVNNKKVTATGILKNDGNYHYDEFGEIVKEKTLTK